MTESVALSIQPVTTLKEMEALAVPWNSLLKETTSADNIFLTWEWLYTWARHYVEDNRLRVLLAHGPGGQVEGIAPMYLRRMPAYRVLGLQEMRLLGTEEVCSAYLDFIVSEKHKANFLEAIFRYLHHATGERWDILTLPEVPAKSSTLDIWDGLVQEAGKVIETEGLTVCPVIDLTAGLDNFLEGIGGNERYNLQRKRRRLEQAGTVSYSRISSLEDVPEAMDAFVSLHQRRWERKGADGAFRSRRFTDFHREIAQRFSEKGWLRLDFLLLDGERIAGVYGYEYHGRYSYYLPGFNPAVEPQASPGILLLYHCVEEAIRDGCAEVDLLRGWADYKLAWATGLRRCLTLRQYNRSARAAALKLINSSKEAVKILVR